jgi:hypothetical protein
MHQQNKGIGVTAQNSEFRSQNVGRNKRSGSGTVGMTTMLAGCAALHPAYSL